MEDTANVLALQGDFILPESKIVAFFRQFKVIHHAGRCGISKAKGVSTGTLLMTLVSLPFLGQNIYRAVVNNQRCEIGKDAVYDFLASSRFSWRRFLLQLALQATAMLDALTHENRETVLILDDTAIERPRAKKVELLARVFDHCEGRFLKGFRMLTLAWSDGASLIPLDFALLSSAAPCNRYQNATKAVDRRSCGAMRRREATTKSTALLVPMLRRVLAAGTKARYLLMDSWFGLPAIISALCPFLPVICMVKRTPKILYWFGGKRLTLEGIYREIKKRRGRAKVLASAVITLNGGQSARLVFVRDRRKKDWLALLSTDLSLPEADVVRIYGKRWDIEVFFRTAKQFLGLEKGCQARDFDSLIAHATIVLIRSIILSVEQRRNHDPRTLGLLFHACCEEMRDLSYLESLMRILDLTRDRMSQNNCWPEHFYQVMADAILGQAIDFLGLKANICQRTQRIAA
jgi:hypothetical protein